MTTPQAVVVPTSDAAVPASEIKFFKGADYATPRLATGVAESDAEKAIIGKIQESLTEAVNAKNVSFLLGSGCSSYMKNGGQVGISTMKPLAQEFTGTKADTEEKKTTFLTVEEKKELNDSCGLNVESYTGQPFTFDELFECMEFAILYEEAHGNRQIRDYCASMITRLSCE